MWCTVWFEAIITDNSPVRSSGTYSHEPGSISLPELPKFVTATDAAGNETECTFTVTVTDVRLHLLFAPKL
jgi:hypothetical protein